MPLPSIKKVTRVLLRILVSALTLIWALSKVDLPRLGDALESVNWFQLLGVWIFNAGLFWLRSFRLQLVLKKLDCPVGIHTLFRSSAVMALYGLILPGLFSLAAKWYVLKTDTGKGSQTLCAMLYNQVSVLMVMVILGLAALMIANPFTAANMNDTQTYLLPLVCTTMLLFVLSLFVVLSSRSLGVHVDSVGYALIRVMPKDYQARAETFLQQMGVFRSLNARFHLAVAAMTVVTGAIGGGIFFWLAARSASITLDPMTCVWLFAVVYVLGRLPISAGNLGIRESTLIFLLGFYGVESSDAFFMSMIVFSALLFLAAIGAIYQVSWSLKASKQ